MTSSIKRWGNSMAIRIPKSLVEKASIGQGTRVKIEVKQGRIILTPIRKSTYRLKDLVGAITKGNRHGAVETGSPRGREAW